MPAILDVEIPAALTGLRAKISEVDNLVTAEEKNLPQMRTHLKLLKKYASDKIPAWKNECAAQFKKNKDEAIEETIKVHLESLISVELEVEVAISTLEVIMQENDAQSTRMSLKEEKTTTIKLPKIEFPKFEGDITKFHEFWSAFTSAIDSTNLSVLDKFVYLRAYVQGAAAEVIAGLELTANNYQVAKDLLYKRYGNLQLTINTHYTAIRKIPCAENHPRSIRSVIDSIEKHLRSLEVLKEDTNNNILYSLLYEKFPKDFLLQVENKMELEPGKSSSTVTQLRRALDHVITQREYVETFSGTGNKHSNTANNKAKESTPKPTAQKLTENKPDGKTEEPKKVPECKFCKNAHFSDACTQFKTLAGRVNKVKNMAVCGICLHTGHENSACKFSKPCFHCKKRREHHQALCPQKFGENELKQPSTSTLLCSHTKTSGLVYAEAPVEVKGKTKQTLLLFDLGSEKSYITESLYKKLKIQVRRFEPLIISKFGGTTTTQTETPIVEINVKLIDGTFMPVEAYVVPRIMLNDTKRTLPKAHVDNNELFKSLHFADNGTCNTTEILIGANYLFDFFTFEKLQLKENLYLIGSKLGWLLGGRASTHAEGPTQCLVAVTPDDIQQLWSLDTLGITEQATTDEDDAAVQHFYQTVSYDQKEGYTVSWPWKTFPPDLPDNYGLALGHLRSLIKRLTPSSLQAYNEIFMQQLREGIIEKGPDKTPHIQHYLPHHGVLSPGKTTPLRIVFNGSAKTRKANYSLNDCLIRGQNLLEDLVGILIRFRLHDIALTADIEKAFLQINLREADRDAVRFLWLKDVNKPVDTANLQIFRFTKIPFGVITSPFLLNITLRLHLQKYPTLEHLNNDLYVDNLITGTSTSQEAVSLYSEGKQMFREAGMNLRKWKSNSDAVNIAIKDDLEQNNIVSVLGLLWNSQRDTLGVKPFSNPTTSIITKRTVLQTTSSVYDPLGLFSPILILAKIFLKRLWIAQYTWDDVLEEQLQEKWCSIRQELEKIPSIEIIRNLSTEANVVYQLHIFTDASQEAYAAVAYLRQIGPERTDAKILFGKARVTPIKTITIPRLELIAFVTGVRILKFLEKILHQQRNKFIQPILWTDSKCVLAWLNSQKILPVFVKKRIQEICVAKAQFRYVPTEENPADVATRGCTIIDLEKSLWWGAPHWLKQSEESWPATKIFPTRLLPEENNSTHTLITVTPELPTGLHAVPNLIDIRRFSSFTTLLRTTARCQQAIRFFKKQPSQFNLEEAELAWLTHEQHINYGEVSRDLTKVKQISYIRNLTLYLDENNLLRCDGRIKKAELPLNTEYPILLAKDSYFTQLLILHFHCSVFHAGTAHTLARLRERFWLPHGRRIVYKTIKNQCFKCRRFNTKPFRMPTIAPLPACRITQVSMPFENTGIDIFGPFFIRNSTDAQVPKVKRWVAIFTCLTIRAVHLEVLQTMRASEFLHAFRRFTARRGCPKLIISDNAPQFGVLDTALTEIWSTLQNDSTVQRYFSTHQITWKFIPPASPWMGGAYERLIQLIKNAYERTHNKIVFSDRQFVTVTAEIENIVNTRPLTYLGQEVDTPLLTPNHFLQLRYPAIPLRDSGETQLLTPDTEKIIRLWKKSQVFLDHYWKYWQKHYLLSLRERADKLQAYRSTARTPKIGEVVLLLDPGQNRGTWPMAIITNLITSEDGEVRSVQLRNHRGNIVGRPLSKIAPLELDIEKPMLDSTSDLPAPPDPNSDDEIVNMECELVTDDSDLEDTGD